MTKYQLYSNHLRILANAAVTIALLNNGANLRALAARFAISHETARVIVNGRPADEDT